MRKTSSSPHSGQNSPRTLQWACHYRLTAFAATLILAAYSLCVGVLHAGGQQQAVAGSAIAAHDWPCWGYDNSRLGASPAVHALPESLSLLWSRSLPAPKRAWLAQKDDVDKLEFDLSYSPVVAGKHVYVSSMTNDSVSAYATDDGALLWQFFADGPLRLAPTVAAGSVYAVSDDGRLYCLNAADGALRWDFMGAPASHLVLGNRRVISLWPARGAALVADGTVYFASGVWPFLGTCVYALDAHTGRVQWSNTGHSSEWQPQPHGGAFAFAGIAPQGYSALAGDTLVVAGGRSLPALFDRHNGKLLYHNAQAKPAGGYRVMTDGEYYYNHGRRYFLATGQSAGQGTPDHDCINALHSKVDTLRDQLDSEVFESIVADNKLIISTIRGTLYCFGSETAKPPLRHPWHPRALHDNDSPSARQARELLDQFGIRDGWALVPGGADEDFLDAILLHSALHVVVLENAADLRLQLRRRYADAGLYGERIAIMPGHIKDLRYPEYITSLILVPNPERAGLHADSKDAQLLYNLLRPYTGRAWIKVPAEQLRPTFFQRLKAWARRKTPAGSATRLADFAPADGRLDIHPDAVVLARTGPLPGAGQWTHQHANSAQSVISHDELVRPPFAPIWFGTTANNHVLPRHHAGPRPQVAGGVLAILGVETISARCVYTGRELWVKEFPGIGHAFTSMELEAKWQAGESVYMVNDPGATYIGSPFVTLPDSIYLRYHGHIYRLRPNDGTVLGKWPLPALPEDTTAADVPDWGHISVQDDCVIATSNPYIFMEGKLGKLSNGWDGSASRRIMVMNRFSGDVLWHRDAAIGFRHNAICSHGQRIFVNDLLSAKALDLALRRGMPINQRPRLYALDLHSGRELWAVESDVFGTFLSYSSVHDVLLEGGTKDGRRHLEDEPSDRLIARSGKDGSVLWQRQENYSGPLIIHDDMVISGRPGPAISLLTGMPKNRTHPLTGEDQPWRYWKSYGCGSSNASTHLLLFRSGAAGFCDLEHDSGTGNLGGFKSGCTASMIAADGILNAPDYTRTCTCSYQNQTSLGLVHRPEMDLWTCNQPIQSLSGTIRQVGVNIAAPGDRRAENDTLWLHSPRQAPSPYINVLLECGSHADGVRIIGADGPDQAANCLDGLFTSRWSINDNRRGQFREHDMLSFTLSEPVTLSEWTMAWKGPADTEFAIQIKNRTEWETVFQGKGSGSGQNMASYSFPPRQSAHWRLQFGTHADHSKDSQDRRRNHTLAVYEVRLGDLDQSAYAFFAPKTYWRRHSLLSDAPDSLRWIVSSGVKDLRRVLLPATFDPQANYELTMHFSETDDVAPRDQVFSVLVQGRVIQKKLDVVATTGGSHRHHSLVCRNVKLNDALQIDFPPYGDTSHGATLCGFELRPMQ